MCGRYAIAYSSEELPSHFQSQHLPVEPRLAKGEHHDRSYNVAPTSDGAVYRAKDHELRYMKWGLVPHWTKSVKDFKTYKTFNARVENLQESRMWAQCCQNKRCVIPLNGYYEWVTKGKKKIPYYVVRKDGKLAFVAGLYDYLESEDLWTYSIITAKAPKELTWLHTRMPVILEPGSEAWDTWMDPEKTDWTQEELDELLAANYDDKMLAVYQVSEEVNKVGSSSESMVKPIFKEDKDKFKLERFPEEEEGGEAEGEPATKRFKAEAKEPESGKGLTGKIGGGYDVKKEQRGRMVGPDQEEDLEIPETAVADENADEIEEAFVKDDEDVDLEEEYLKQSEDEEVAEEDLEDVAGGDDEEYVEGADDNEVGSDYEVAQEGEKEEDITTGQSIGERVKNEDTARAEEGNLSKADIRKEQRTRKNKTSATAKGDTGEHSAKWGSMTASEAGRKGGSRSSRSGNTGGAEEEEEGEGTSGHRGRGNFGKGDTGEHSARWGSMTASEAGRKGGRKSSRSGNTGGDEGEEEEETSGRKGSGNYGKGDTGEHSARWGSMTASEAGRKGGRKSSRSGNTGGDEGEQEEGEETSGHKGRGNFGKGDTGEHSARWGSMTASEAGRKGGRKSSRSGNTGGGDEGEEEEEISGRKGSGNFGKGDTGEHSARWGSMTASEAGRKGGRKSSRSGNTGGGDEGEEEEETSGRKGSGNYGKGDTGEHSARWGSMTASEAGRKGGRKSSRSSNTGGDEGEEEGEETSGHKGRGNFGKGDTGEHSARWGSMTASEAGRKGGRKSSRSSNTGGDEGEEEEGEETSGRKGSGNYGKGDTGEHSSRWGSMTASEAGKKGGRTRKQHT
ncbi:hypothetical protein HG537_0A03610 [Torulaspora globosa]|uniref:DUF159-domain-containing protein n=1 Tax=Torulaspora globosa TaxID=48254 RepID=A0A7H9HJP4_9SACH|nr:hypothetical protein HG537_0A03610 [Torulaspora sp. CBS 2947]